MIVLMRNQLVQIGITRYSFILNFCEILRKIKMELYDFVVIASNNYDNYASEKCQNITF